MNGKVLVVDDDAESRMIVSDYLARLDVNHTLVASAGECIKRLVSDPGEYFMILMDIHMPNLSGADACVWIKDSEIDPPKGIPIIAMTGDTAFFDSDALSRFGMEGVLHKPVTMDQLQSTLAKHTKAVRLN